MNYLAKRLDVIIVLALVISLGFNWYLLNNKPKPVIQTVVEIMEVEKPITITKIVTKYETRLATESVIIPLTADVLEKAKGYEILLNSELELSTNPLYIVEDNKGKLFIPAVLTGDARLAFLKWQVEMKLEPKLEYQKNRLPIDIGFGLSGLEPDLGICMDLPFLTDNDIMIGLRGINIGYRYKINNRSSIRMGLGLDYGRKVSTFIGMRTQI